MKYMKLGNSGLNVSQMCLGTMSFGWTTDKKTCLNMLDCFVDSGGNFFDTANIYAEGESEKIIGSWLKNKPRDRLIIATKVRYRTGEGPNDIGLGKKHIMVAIEDSLRRLQTDYIDLYQIHCWDASTPLEETLITLDDLVRSCKVRYIGICNFTAWQLQKAMDISRFMNLEICISLQALYNLLDRYIEWDIFHVCKNEGLGLLCWSPLAGGWLTGLIRKGMTTPPVDSRIELAEKYGWSESWSNYNHDATWKVLDTLFSIVEETGKSPAQVALNWLIQRPGVSSAIIGSETIDQLNDNLGTLDWSLDIDQINQLDAISLQNPPRYPYGFINRFN